MTTFSNAVRFPEKNLLLCDNHGVSWVLCVKRRQIHIKGTWEEYRHQPSARGATEGRANGRREDLKAWEEEETKKKKKKVYKGTRSRPYMPNAQTLTTAAWAPRLSESSSIFKLYGHCYHRFTSSSMMRFSFCSLCSPIFPRLPLPLYLTSPAGWWPWTKPSWI
jgi:hypothetical protein